MKTLNQPIGKGLWTFPSVTVTAAASNAALLPVSGIALSATPPNSRFSTFEFFTGQTFAAGTITSSNDTALGHAMNVLTLAGTGPTTGTSTVRGADDPAGPWTDLASSLNGAATTALVGGVTVSETGAGSTRTVEVRDLYLTNEAAHPRRFLRFETTRP